MRCQLAGYLLKLSSEEADLGRDMLVYYSAYIAAIAEAGIGL